MYMIQISSLFRCSALVAFFSISIHFTIAQTFTKMTGLGLQAVQNGQTDWGDYDNDGDLDIILSGLQGSSISTKVYRNNGDNTVTEITGIFVGQLGESVAWIDYDRDGDLDILAEGFNASASNTVIKFYQNSGSDSFNHDKTVTFAGNNSGSMEWGDYDNDGDLDLLLTGNAAIVYANDGTNSFSVQTTLTTLSSSDGSWGDYDNDGDLDIVLVGNSSSSGTNTISKVYKNNGNGTFTEQTGISLQGFLSGSVDWGDYNNDGYLDLVISGTDALLVPSTVVYSNNGDNTFTLRATFLVNGDANVQWADMDNDGDLDIVLHNILDSTLGNRLQIYTNNGNNAFAPIISVTTLIGGNGKVGDFDNDGDLDILSSNASGNSIMYINNTTTVNTAPTAPGNFQITSTNGSDITLTWGKASDAQTAQNGLSYNLYLYEIGQTDYLKTPDAAPQNQSSNGKRRVAYRGTVQYNSSGYTFKGLPSGAYAGSVQAVDAGLMGGSFATEASFSVITLTGVGIHVANSQITNTTTLIQYSLNSTTGVDGTWIACTTPSTTVDYGNGGFSVWVRQTSFPSNNYKVATIATATPAPAIGIDYVNETTNQIVSSLVEYSTNSDMSASTVGVNAKALVTPGQNLYFRTLATATTVASLIQTMTIAARPSTPAYSIDFVNETTNQVVSSTDDVSTTIKITNAAAGTGAKVTITPSQNLYFQTRATASSFKSTIQTLIVPARPATTAYSIDFANEQTLQNVITTDDYSINSDLSNASAGANAKIIITPAQNLYFRIRATTSAFKSTIQTLIVPARPATTAYSIDFANEQTLQNVITTDDYSINSDLSNASAGANAKIIITPAQNLYFRIRATTSAFKSTIQTLIVPARPATTAYSIDFANEQTLQNVITTDDYSINSDLSGASAGANAKITITPGQNLYFRKQATASAFKSTIQTLVVPARPATTAYSIDFANEQTLQNVITTDDYSINADLSNASAGANAKIIITPGQNLYFRKQATTSAFKSTIQTLVVPARPATTAYSIDFANEQTLQNVATTDDYSINSDLSNASAGANAKITITPGQNLYFRTQATRSAFKSTIQTLVVPARPAATAYSIDFTNEQTLQNVATTDDYSINSDLSNASSGANAKITITPGQNLYFRTQATTSAFKSTIQTLIVPARPATTTYSIDFASEQTLQNVATTDDYSINSDLSNASAGANAKITITPGQNLYFRTRATTSAFKSAIQTLIVPARSAATAYSIDFANEQTLQNVITTDDYSINSDLSGASAGANAKITITPGQNLYFRKQATASAFKSTIQTLVVPARPATTTYSIDFASEQTLQNVITTDDYSINSDLSGASAGANAKITITPGQNLYFRTQATTSAFKSTIQTLVVPARPATTAYSIDFASEQTLQNVATTDDYSINSDLSNASAGANAKIIITPGQNLYFRTRATTSAFKSTIQTLVVPARPASPVFTIDFNNETTQSIVPSTHEYATNSSMNGAISGVGLKLPVTPAQNLYFRIKATGSAFKSLPYTLTVPGRPTTPSYSIDFTNETTAQTVAVADEYSSSALMTSAVSGNGIKIALIPGQNKYFRTKATASSFNSSVQALTVPSRVVLQFTVNYINETTTEIIPANVQYSTDASLSSFSVGTGAKISLLPGQDLYFRGLATNLSFQTDIQHLIVPSRIASPPLFSINFIGEKTIENISSDVEFSQSATLSNLTKGKDAPISVTPGTDLYFRYAATSSSFRSLVQHLIVPERPSSPNFSIDYFNEQTAEDILANVSYSQNSNMSNALTGNNTKVNITPGVDLYFCYAATSTYFYSCTQHLVIPNRQPIPSYSINFIAETSNSIISSSDQYSLDAAMRTAANGNDAPIAITPGQTLYFRTNATTTSFKSLIQTLLVPARPASPTIAVVNDDTNTFDWMPNATYPQISNYEFSIDNGATWAVATIKPLMVESIDLVAGAVQVRLGATNSHFKSEPLISASPYTKNIITAIEKQVDNTLTIFPNPGKERITVANLENGQIDISILSLNGSILLQKNNVSAFDNELDISSLQNGIYVILVKINDSTKKLKFVKL